MARRRPPDREADLRVTVTCVQAQERQGCPRPPDPGRGRQGPPPDPQGLGPADPWFWTPGLQNRDPINSVLLGPWLVVMCPGGLGPQGWAAQRGSWGEQEEAGGPREGEGGVVRTLFPCRLGTDSGVAAWPPGFVSPFETGLLR